MIRILSCPCLLLALACSNLPDRPEPPDMAPLVEAYRNPTADLDQAVADQLAAELRARIDLADALDNLASLIDEVLAPILEQEEEAGLTPRGEPGRSSVVLEGDGFARIEHVCGGWGATPTVDEDANGRLETATRRTSRTRASPSSRSRAPSATASGATSRWPAASSTPASEWTASTSRTKTTPTSTSTSGSDRFEGTGAVVAYQRNAWRSGHM